MDAITTFRRSVHRAPDRTFAFDDVASITYADADARTDAIATALSESGLAPGETLGLSSPDSVDQLLAIVGAWKAGVLPGFIDARTSDDALPYFVQDVGAKLILATPELHERLRIAGASEVAEIATFGNGVRPSEVNEHGAEVPFYLSYTSGTTGAPKGAILLSGPVTLGTACIADRLGVTPDDVLLATTPTASSFQLVAALLPAIHVGASIGLVAGRSLGEIWSVARQRRASVLVAYPLTLADVVNAPEASQAGSPFRVALSGGSPLAPRIKRAFAERLGISLLESYGQSELGGFMALGRPDDGERSLSGYVGRPLPDRPSYIGGPDGIELSPGQVGEVLVPWGYFDAYRNKPDETRETLRGRILHCGLGVADAQGYLKVLGRTREAAAAGRRGGFLRELEDAFYEHDDVLHAAVVERASDGAVAAFLEPLPGRHPSVDELASFAAGRVPEGLAPVSTTLLERMPRTFSGKADRMSLSSGS